MPDFPTFLKAEAGPDLQHLAADHNKPGRPWTKDSEDSVRVSWCTRRPIILITQQLGRIPFSAHPLLACTQV
ncbi:hypothetical protein GCM10009720_26860 [Yaniella flava]|uniref:Uncharacterized protein n=1 Tax=Yaniella flava TaxID=287930 RepID=A0ABP5GDG9_9MICC